MSMQYNRWAIRGGVDNELVLLIRSKHTVDGKPVFTIVREILCPDFNTEFSDDESIMLRLKGSFNCNGYEDNKFTVAEWETWFVFELAPAIEIYTTNRSWKWRTVKP